MSKSALALVTATLLLSTPAIGAPLDITDIVGGWSNVVGGANLVVNNVAAQGTDTIRWGDGGLSDSGYNFTPGPDNTNVPLNTNILLGTFVHVNDPIYGGSITSVDYGISFTTNGLPAILATTLMFDHNETPNGLNPCPDGGANYVGVNINGCADIVTVTSAILNSPIQVGLDTYYFNLLGFSLDGGNTFDSQFASAETTSNSAQLYGVVGQQISVPEPATLAIFGLGLVGLGFIRRRRKA